MRSASRSGQGLAAMAAARGLSSADLVAAVSSALEGVHQGMSAESANATAQRLVERLMQQAPGRAAAAGGFTTGGSELDVSA
jgi:hypothetical protein